MNLYDHGGPAFPVVTNQYSYAYEKDLPAAVSGGMTLRDYFAAKAMQALIARVPYNEAHGINRDAVSAASYEHADAMLKARES